MADAADLIHRLTRAIDRTAGLGRGVRDIRGQNKTVPVSVREILFVEQLLGEAAAALQAPPGTAIVHFDAEGEQSYWSTDGVRLLTIDERAPGDRVYEMSGHITPDQLAAMIGDDPIGNQHDERHAAIAAFVTAAEAGTPHLRIIRNEEGNSDA